MNPPRQLHGGYTISAQHPRFSRSTATFSILNATAAAPQHYLAVAIQQDQGNLLQPSVLYAWDERLARYRIADTFAIPGASFVAHTRVPSADIGGAGMEHVLLWASLYSFDGGCQHSFSQESQYDRVSNCTGNKQASSHVHVMLWNETTHQFVTAQLLPSKGASHVLTFTLPCKDLQEAENDGSECVRHYLAISNRQIQAPNVEYTHTSAYLEQFDAGASLWVWDAQNVFSHSTTVDHGQYVEIDQAFNGAATETIPSRVTADACVDGDEFIDMLLPYGPCYTYQSGEFNEGFCIIDDVCHDCQASCALECRDPDVACVMTDASQQALLAKRQDGLWPDMAQVAGLRGSTSMLHFSHEGESFLAVAQSMCDLYKGAGDCVEEAITQPQSAVLQWSGIDPLDQPQHECSEDKCRAKLAQPLLGKILAKPPRHARPGLQELHAFNLRLEAGALSSWHVVMVPSDHDPSSAPRLVPLLVGASLTEGLISYPWVFERTAGLSNVDALIARPVVHSGSDEAMEEVGLYSAHPRTVLEAKSLVDLQPNHRGHHVYAASGGSRRFGSLRALSAHDAEWASCRGAEKCNFPARGHVGFRSKRGGPVYDR